jgi:hypothetical protein
MVTTATPTHGRSARLFLRISCSLLIILFGLISLLFWEANGRVFWLYCCIMVGLDALCCLVIAAFGYEHSAKRRWARFWKQILHWLGFVGVVYLLNSLIVMGTFLPKNAGLILLGLLGFSVYLAGLAIDLWLILVGVLLVLLAMSVVWAHQYVWFLVIPIGVAVILMLVLSSIIRQSKSKDAPG